MLEQSYPTPCKSCGKQLYGPVSFCPYCAAPSKVSPLKDTAPETATKVTPKIEPTPPPIATKSTVITGGADSATKAPEIKPDIPPVPPQTQPSPAAVPIPDEVEKAQQPASESTAPAESNATVPAKKSSTGLIIGIVLVVIVLLGGAFKFFTGSSPKNAEVSKNPIPQGASPATPPKSIAPPSPPPSMQGTQPPSSIPSTPPVTEKQIPPSAVKQAVKPVKPAQKKTEKPIDEQIQDAITLYDSGKVKEAAKRFKAILDVVPDNRLAKFYLQKCLDTL